MNVRELARKIVANQGLTQKELNYVKAAENFENLKSAIYVARSETRCQHHRWNAVSLEDIIYACRKDQAVKSDEEKKRCKECGSDLEDARYDLCDQCKRDSYMDAYFLKHPDEINNW